MACAQPGPRSSARGRPRSSASRRCRPARSTFRCAASGRSRRPCGIWSLPRTWLGRAILGIEQPFHPIGQTDASAEADGLDMSIFTTVTPSYDEVLEVRAGRVAMVRDFLASVTSDELAATRKNPWEPEYQETTLSCLHVILQEEWEHHRYAVRDLDAIEAKS